MEDHTDNRQAPDQTATDGRTELEEQAEAEQEQIAAAIQADTERREADQADQAAETERAEQAQE